MRFNFKQSRNRILTSALVAFLALGNVLAPTTAVQAKVKNPTSYSDPKVTAYQIKNGTKLNSKQYDKIQDAIDAADGTNQMIIELASGKEYHQMIEINKPYVTLKSEDSSKPATLVGETGPDDGTMIYIEGHDVTVDSVNITGLKYNAPKSGKCVVGIKIKGNNTHINNCKIYNMGCEYTKDAYEGIGFNAHGIICSNSKNDSDSQAITGVKVTNCELYNLTLGNSEALVMNGNVKNFVISNNSVHDCDNIGIDIIGYEKSGDNYSKYDRARDGDVINNIVYNISSGNNLTYRESASDKPGKCAGGIYVDGGTKIKIENNYVENCDIGLELASEAYHMTTDYITVRNNIFINNNELGGISIGGCGENNGYAANCTIQYNTIYNEDECVFRFQRANDSTNKISHNIFIAKNGSGIKTYANDSSGYGIDKNTVENNYISNDYKKDNPSDKDNKFKATDIKFNKETGTITFNSNGTDLTGYGYGQSDDFKPVENDPANPENPIGPTEPTEPTEPTKPSETKDPSDTTKPSGTTNPADKNKDKDKDKDKTNPDKTAVTPSVTTPVISKNVSISDKKSNAKYKITKIIKKNGKIVGGNVEYATVLNKKCKKVTVPNRIKINGVLFNVTSIGNNAAKNCKKLTSVLIGKNVTKIGKNSFAGCKKLKTITIKSVKIKKIGANAFKGINKKAKFIINKKKLAAYRKMIRKAKAPKTCVF